MLDICYSQQDMTRSLVDRRDARSGREETPVQRSQVRADQGETHFIAFQVPVLRRDQTRTPTLSEHAAPRPPDLLRRPVPESADDEISKLGEGRSTLLAKRFEGKSSAEDVARIAILTDRLRKLNPRVTAREREAAEQLVDDVETLSARLENLRTKFGA